MEMLGKSKCTFNELHSITKNNECIPENEICRMLGPQNMNLEK